MSLMFEPGELKILEWLKRNPSKENTTFEDFFEIMKPHFRSEQELTDVLRILTREELITTEYTGKKISKVYRITKDGIRSYRKSFVWTA